MIQFEKVYSNGFVLLIPIIIWNIIFTSKLPTQFSSQIHNSEFLFVVIAIENICRTALFVLLFFTKVEWMKTNRDYGLAIYVFGCMVYFISWMILIYLPESNWSKSIIGFTAPAYTPSIWLVGIIIIVKTTDVLKIVNSKWPLIVSSFVFIIIHVWHLIMLYQKQIKRN